MKRHIYLKCLMKARELELTATREINEIQKELSPFIVAAQLVTLK